MASAAELKEKYRQRRESQQQQSAPADVSPAPTPTQIVDRGIKGTLIDDHIYLFLARYGLPILLLFAIGIAYLGLERIIGAKIITPIRIWSLTAALYGFMCWKRFSFGLGGWIAVLSVSISTSGYLWEVIQAWVGKR